MDPVRFVKEILQEEWAHFCRIALGTQTYLESVDKLSKYHDLEFIYKYRHDAFSLYLNIIRHGYADVNGE